MPSNDEIEIWPGEPYPLGASHNGSGTNFSLFSEVAEKVELCLFDDNGTETRVVLPEYTGYCWHGYLPGIMPGQAYGFRVHGPYDPHAGHRCNPHKLIVDPYATAIDGKVQWNQAVFGYTFGAPFGPPNEQDSAPFVPRSVVASPFFDWGDDRPPRVPWHETIIYEAHVRGLTMRHPKIPRDLRGTYAGIGHPAMIEYLRDLGITAIELQPVHQFVHDHALIERGLRNYWGYNSLGYFAPHGEYAAHGTKGEQVSEFKSMVKSLHAADIEVILDVVYNHTAEGNHLGPTLCFRGLDNDAYYRLADDDRAYYFDFTGCGNSFNMRSPQVLRLIMDSLRYWVEEMHVDGFRFDLAAALARELFEVDRLAAFMNLIQQDPVVSRVKLIAEPWDVGEGGYQVGNFPVQWSEWNGIYRDVVRDFWRGQDQTIGEFAARFTGSSDLYETTGRRPHASINFVTCHDGFTLRDLVSYNEKHNFENGEDNRDGESHNRSWNCGAEGPTDDPAILELRGRQRRNMVSTLLLSAGVPMLLAGDEIGRSQRGNNNAYCQDSDLTWLQWDDADADFAAFTRRLIELRREHPTFQRRRWFQGTSIRGSKLHDIGWFRPDGAEMAEADWRTGFAHALGVFLNGRGISATDRWGRRIVDDSFYLVFNASPAPIEFRMPTAIADAQWRIELETTHPLGEPRDTDVRSAGGGLVVAGRSLSVLTWSHDPSA